MDSVESPQSGEPLFEDFRNFVERYFPIEEELFEFNAPTFYVSEIPDMKNRFLALLKDLDHIGYLATMRRVNRRIRIQVFRKIPTRPSDRRINVALFFATIGTTFIAGFIQSMRLENPFLNAGLFTIAIMSVLGLHEMGHKLAIKKHGLEASDPYFIPGPPPLGTFGAVISQKSMIPNKDALFDLGAMGPIVGFVVAVIVTIIGLPLSELKWVETIRPGALPPPILYEYLIVRLLEIPPNPQHLPYLEITLHPIALAGYVGILVTMLNLIPAGQLDGGHIAYCFLGRRSRRIVGFAAIGFLFLTSYWFFALFALFTMFQPHPDPLDTVSKVSLRRKLVALVVIAIFVLSLTPPQFPF